MLTQVSSSFVEHRFRAKYIPDKNGVLHLYQVQEFARPIFREEGWECDSADSSPRGETGTGRADAAARRARRLAFDLVASNPQLDAFFTLTYAPKIDLDRAVYADVYTPLKAWLSNRVQRKGLSYVMTAERHKKGGIHFHGVCNASALHLVPAINPHTGEPIFDNSQQVFNIKDWEKMGFSTCKVIGGEFVDAVKVAKYITKYITKDADKVGGRYLYHGGSLARPTVLLGDTLDEVTQGCVAPPCREYTCLIDGVGEYTERTYI